MSEKVIDICQKQTYTIAKQEISRFAIYANRNHSAGSGEQGCGIVWQWRRRKS